MCVVCMYVLAACVYLCMYEYVCVCMYVLLTVDETDVVPDDAAAAAVRLCVCVWGGGGSTAGGCVWDCVCFLKRISTKTKTH